MVFEDMLKRLTAETVCGKQKCEMIIVVEEVIVFSSPKGNGSKNELNLNLQKLLLSVTIKHNSDTNNLISCFPCFSLQPVRNYFTTMAAFCLIKHDGTNVITGRKNS